MSENNDQTIKVKQSELNYVGAALHLLNIIGKELQFKEPSISKRIRNLSAAAHQTIREHLEEP